MVQDENKDIMRKIELKLFRPLDSKESGWSKFKTRVTKWFLLRLNNLVMWLERETSSKGKEQKRLMKRWMFVNRSFKFYFLTPLARLGKRLLGRWLVTQREQIPDTPWNTNFFIFRDATSEAMMTYFDEFLTPLYGPPKCSVTTWKSCREKYLMGQSRASEAIFFLRDMGLTIALEDTAYRTFLDIFMFKIQEKMNKEWNPEIVHKVPCYINRVDGFMPYYMAWFKEKGLETSGVPLGGSYQQQGFRMCTHKELQGAFWAGSMSADFKAEHDGGVLNGVKGDLLVIHPSGKWDVLTPGKFLSVFDWVGEAGVIGKRQVNPDFHTGKNDIDKKKSSSIEGEVHEKIDKVQERVDKIVKKARVKAKVKRDGRKKK